MTEPLPGKRLPMSPVSGEVTPAAGVDATTASATMLTKDPEALLAREMLLSPSAPKMMVWVELKSSTGWLPLASSSSPGELAKRTQLAESEGPSLRVLSTCRVCTEAAPACEHSTAQHSTAQQGPLWFRPQCSGHVSTGKSGCYTHPRVGCCQHAST